MNRIPNELSDCIRDPAEFVTQLQARRDAMIDHVASFHYTSMLWFARCLKPVSHPEFDRQFEV